MKLLIPFPLNSSKCFVSWLNFNHGTPWRHTMVRNWFGVLIFRMKLAPVNIPRNEFNDIKKWQRTTPQRNCHMLTHITILSLRSPLFSSLVQWRTQLQRVTANVWHCSDELCDKTTKYFMRCYFKKLRVGDARIVTLCSLVWVLSMLMGH